VNRFGKYDLLVQLATGGMAEIWLARVSGAAGFEKLVVVKRLLSQLSINPDYVEMFLDEARINARLSHGNVVQVLELGQVEGRYFMSMEYVAGMTVAQMGKRATQRLGQVPQDVACGVVAQACAGLHHAHERTQSDGTPLNIIHRDVSPQNLIISFEGQVKVVDFGIAKAEGRIAQTRAGLVKGKSAYMSPEQCLGLPLDRRSDVFALGIVLWELCTSRRLFKRPQPYQTFDAITREDVPPPRALNRAVATQVEAVIMRALARKVEQRYASAGEMQEALEHAMTQAELRARASDLSHFVDKEFPEFAQEQQRLIAEALEKGEVTVVDPVLLSVPMDTQVGYASRRADDKNATDKLPALGDDESERTSISGPSFLEDDDEPDPKTVVRSDALSETGPSRTLQGQQTPPLYWLLLVVGILLIIAAIIWAVM
jgi:eukaryotic-like serine/threonine-protein kinase